jgi:hypothetical protein
MQAAYAIDVPKFEISFSTFGIREGKLIAGFAIRGLR